MRTVNRGEAAKPPPHHQCYYTGPKFLNLVHTIQNEVLIETKDEKVSREIWFLLDLIFIREKLREKVNLQSVSNVSAPYTK